MEESCGKSKKANRFDLRREYHLRRTPARDQAVEISATKKSDCAVEPAALVEPQSIPLSTPKEDTKFVEISANCLLEAALVESPSMPVSTPKEDTKAVVSGQPETVQLPRRYPSRVRVSAVQNFQSSCVTPEAKSRIRKVESRVEKEVGNSTKKRPKKEVTKVDESNCNDEAADRKKVRESIYLFQTIYRSLVLKEQSSRNAGGLRGRFDLKALNLFKERSKECGNGSAVVGSVPGVEVGDEFHFRVELHILSIHRLLQAGIDFVKQGERDIAVSIVSSHSERYNGDLDKSDILVYCGGGLQSKDEKLENGNLALKNCIDAKTPVRVVHSLCFKYKVRGEHYEGMIDKQIVTYIYAGLYLVEKCSRKKENNGCYVIMFQLRRLPGQRMLNVKEVKDSMRTKARLGLVYAEDISQGMEKVAITVANTVDKESLPSFIYTTKILYPSNYKMIPSKGCDCVNGCSDDVKCACAVKNGGEIPFNTSGAIVEAKPLVYECGPSCKCPPTCQNRVSQHGMKFPLEVFKTKRMGWGVRSLTPIPSGSFICEYTGEMIDDIEAEKRTNDEYLFEIGHNYYDESLWEGLSTSIPSLQMNNSCEQAEDEVTFTVDASKYGNVGRFFNHHCTPNLYAQNLLYDHDDKRMPHVMLFASEDIPPLQELTYHYNYALDSVQDSDGNIKKKNCYCGSWECTGRLY